MAGYYVDVAWDVYILLVPKKATADGRANIDSCATQVRQCTKVNYKSSAGFVCHAQDGRAYSSRRKQLFLDVV